MALSDAPVVTVRRARTVTGVTYHYLNLDGQAVSERYGGRARLAILRICANLCPVRSTLCMTRLL